MQNEETLKELGFQKNLHNEWFYRGEKATFVADVITCNGPTYVVLFKVSDKVDMRPLSDRKGRHFKIRLKDCCSSGSVERAIKFYDN